MLSSALALVTGLLPLAAGQFTFTTPAPVGTVTLAPAVPNGVQGNSSSYQSTYPLVCDAGCADVAPIYYYCFINNTLPNGQQNSIITCLGYLCQQANYDLLMSCLNCIVANGNEQPLGYYSNTSMTAAPTSAVPGQLFNPNGLLNSTQASGWLSNVTDRCLAANFTVTGGTTVTATPTTTGPYYTSWASGATVSISVWTGLTSYTSAISDAYASRTVNESLPVGVTGITTGTVSSTPSLSAPAGGSSSSASASAASASASSSAKSSALRRASVPAWARVLSMVF